MIENKKLNPGHNFQPGRTYNTEYFQATNFQYQNNLFSYDIIRTGKRKQAGRTLGKLEDKVISHCQHDLNKMNKKKYVRDLLPLEPYLTCDDYTKICAILQVDQPDWLAILTNYNKDCEILQNTFGEIEAVNQARSLKWEQEKKRFRLKKTDYHEASNFWIILLLAPFTFFLSFVFLTTKKQAKTNIQKNQANQVWNEKYLAEQKEKFQQKNDRHMKQAVKHWEQNKDTFNNKYRGFTFHRLFLADCDLSFYDAKALTEKKNDKNLVNALSGKSGIYIIWNATKQNKYYVGQTNDLYRRLVNEHFSLKSNLSGDDNSGFLGDFLNKCTFYFSFIYCENVQETKDKIEREIISRLKSVKFGYNKSGGNS